MGIDASTNSIAYAIISDKLESFGEITFDGDTVFARALDAKRKVRALRELFDYEYIAIESAVFVKSASVAIKMAYVFGAIISELMDNDGKVVEVAPLSWQAYIGNPLLTKTEKLKIANEFPGKSKTWYTGHQRKVRKQKTLDWVERTYGIKLQSDNVSDAIGLAYFTREKLTR